MGSTPTWYRLSNNRGINKMLKKLIAKLKEKGVRAANLPVVAAVLLIGMLVVVMLVY